jgi:hypothetical protein
MKYRAGVIFHTNYTVTADSKDDAHDKLRDLASNVEWFVDTHSEKDITNGTIMVSEIEIIDFEEDV